MKYISDRQKRTKLYEDWQRIRETAVKNANGKLPEDFDTQRFPQLPPAVDDLDIENLSMDLSAASIDAEIANELDESGIERVPMADPGLEVGSHL